MKKLALTTAMSLGLAACSSDLTIEQRENIVAAALLAINDLEAQGINYVEASPEVKVHITLACAVAPITVAASVGVEGAQKITDACTVLKRAVQ